MNAAPTQLDIITALDESQGLAPLFGAFRTPGISTAELARGAGCDTAMMERILREELARGNVERDADGWRIAASFLVEYRQAWSAMAARFDVEDAA